MKNVHKDKKYVLVLLYNVDSLYLDFIFYFYQMGELGEALEQARQKGMSKQLKVFFIQNVGIALGVIILFVMARYAEHFNFENISSFITSSEESLDDRVKQLYTGLQEAKMLHGSTVTQ